MSGEFWSFLFADLCNIVAHVDVRKHVNHTSSCLLCGFKDSSTQCVMSLYPSLSSNDLEATSSGRRCFVDMHESNSTQLHKHLGLQLGFVPFLRTKEGKELVVLVFVQAPNQACNLIFNQNDQAFDKARKLVVITSDVHFQADRSIVITYKNYEQMMRCIIHAFLLYKHRVRIMDLNKLLSSVDVGYVHSYFFQPEECIFF